MSSRFSIRASACALFLGLLAAPAWAGPAAAAPPVCTAPEPSTTQPGYLVADPDCDVTGTPFVPLADPAGQPLSEVFTGVEAGAAYRIEVPLNWNGELVVWAHGYRGTGTTVFVDNPGLRAHLVARGFAWAASSYATNGYDVGQGVQDSHRLLDVFRARTGKRTKAVYMHGASMGGHITAVAIEAYPKSFVGAYPICGVLGDAELFDYQLDVNVTAAALTGTPLTFPSAPVPAEYAAQYTALVQSELPKLGTGWGTGTAPVLTETGRKWSAAVEQRSGGERPGFDAAFDFWNSRPGLAPFNTLPFLLAQYPGTTGGTLGQAEGSVVSNRTTLYQLDANPWLTWEELRLNARVLRVSRTEQLSTELTGIPKVEGRPRVPVLSLHNLGDLFVPFSMEQVYAQRAAANGRSKLFVSRAIRALGHCEFTPDETRQGFDDLVGWVRAGKRPGGDSILDRRAVARPDFGCRYTTVDRPNFGSACP